MQVGWTQNNMVILDADLSMQERTGTFGRLLRNKTGQKNELKKQIERNDAHLSHPSTIRHFSGINSSKI